MAVKRLCFCDPGPNVTDFEASPGDGAAQAGTRSGVKKTA
jgi:hypothetical protein